MLHKYKIPLWNLLCLGLFSAALFFLAPHIKPLTESPSQETKAAALQEIGTTRKVWKRGKLASETTSYEKSSTTHLTENKSHKSEGWTTIIWRKDNDSDS